MRIMKRINLLYIVLTALSLSSCSDFLDTLPDNRAEMNSAEKVTSLLVSAYADHAPIMLMEFGTDNVMDNGSEFPVRYQGHENTYLWKDIPTTDNDDPKAVFESYYKAIASANQALKSIEELGDPASLAPYKGEALLCRAYSHFTLANVFCLPYNPETADKDMGLPYAISPETTPFVAYERGTMAQLYEQINKDIEEALPLISDDAYTVPKYHFNRKAAYAFAARFNLFYVHTDKSNYQKVIDYATIALGNQPASMVRNFTKYLPLGAEDIKNAYVQASEPANFLIMPAYSAMARLLGSYGKRYGHSRPVITYETMWAGGPWGTNGSSGFLISKAYGSDQAVRFPKLDEFWEETDKVAQTGFAHIVTVPFTADETLLCRAEAYVFKERYDEAAADLNIWQVARCKESVTIGGKLMNLQTLTPEIINNFFQNRKYCPVVSTSASGNDRTIKKQLHPQGFTVAEGEQENFIQCILHFRRLEGLHDGLRWCDIKRYGIEVGHNREGLPADILKSDDPRRAIQLPADVITAGLQYNQR